MGRENNQIADFPDKSILSGIPIIQRLYGFDINEDDYLEQARYVLTQIGNKETILLEYEACAKPISDDKDAKLFIELPCEATTIEAVSTESLYTGVHDIRTVQVAVPSATVGTTTMNVNQILDSWFENILKKSVYETKGHLVNYVYQGDRLLLINEKLGGFGNSYNTDTDTKGFKLFVYFTKPIVDKDGLTKITEMAAYAIAHYCGLVQAKKNMWMGLQNAGNQVAMAQADYDKFVAKARVPVHLSQNAINQIMDSNVRWTRKRFHEDFDIIR